VDYHAPRAALATLTAASNLPADVRSLAAALPPLRMTSENWKAGAGWSSVFESPAGYYFRYLPPLPSGMKPD
jgi:hypothetical protein